MALAKRRTTIANPARRKKRKNPRRKLSAAQIAAGFGGKRRQSAAKSSRKRKRSTAKRRNAPKQHRRRTVARRRAAPRRKNSHRRRTPRRTVKRNIGEIVSLTLGNPSRRGKRKSMAKAKRRRNASHAHRRTRRHVAHRRHRRNPMGGSWGSEITNALFIVAGAVGSKLGTQMVLGSNNTGIFGYAGNLAVGGVLAWLAKGVLKNAQAAKAVFAGSVVQVVLRAISDYTPFGQYTSQLGMGDYLASNWVTPQRYVDGLNSAQVQIPGGWAPTTVVQSAGVPAGMASYEGM